MPKTFEAKYPGTCAECDERFDVGDEIAYVDGNIVHGDCSTSSDEDEWS